MHPGFGVRLLRNVVKYYVLVLATAGALLMFTLFELLANQTSETAAVPVGYVFFYGLLLATLLLPIVVALLAVIDLMARRIDDKTVRTAAAAAASSLCVVWLIESGDALAIALVFLAPIFFLWLDMPVATGGEVKNEP